MQLKYCLLCLGGGSCAQPAANNAAVSNFWSVGFLRSASAACSLALSLCPSVRRAAVQASGHAKSSAQTATPNSTVLRHAKPSSHRNQPPWVAATCSPATCHSVSGVAAHLAFPKMLWFRSRNSQLYTSWVFSVPGCVLSFLPACLHSIFRVPVPVLFECMEQAWEQHWCMSILNAVFCDGSVPVCAAD